MLLVLVVLFAGCSIFVENFLNLKNMEGLFLSVSTIGMVACTMLFCLASGDFDLSVGSVVASAGVAAVMVINASGSVLLGILAGTVAGGLVGLVNGVVVAKFKINALITTLATMQIVRGLGLIASGGKAVGVMNENFYWLGQKFLGIPRPIWICLLCFAVFGFLLQRTTFGRNTLAVGGNQEAARLAGIAVDRLKITIFTLQGLMAGFAGVVLSSRMAMANAYTTAQGFELSVISSCVLGGVSLTGGVGNMGFVIAGVLIMGIVENAMNLKNVPTFWQYVARGAILLGAVLFDRFKQKR